MSRRDQVGYSFEQVDSLITTVWDPDSALRHSFNPGHLRPSDVPDWLLEGADVQVAYAKAGLTELEKSCLKHTRWFGYSLSELAGSWSVTPEDVERECNAGITRIVHYLNGRRS